MSGEDGTASGRALRVRQARHGDREDVAAISERTWPERDGGDYLADVFPDWVDGDGPDQRTFVAETDAGVVGVVQAVLLSPYEAWYQGMRVHPDHRRRGVSGALNRACVEWSRDRGATVGRLMVFSWNTPGLGAARAKGFEPTTEFRWMQPDPDPDAAPDARIAEDPDAAYAFWAGSRARDHLQGLALDMDESWACSELTRERFHRAAEGTRVLAVGDERGTCATTYRVRDYERDGGDGPERRAEYGVAAWADLDALRDLLAVVARDAADLGADRTRVLVPETVRHVSDAAAAGAALSDEPDFLLSADLSGTG